VQALVGCLPVRAADVCDRDRADAELYPVLRIPLSTLQPSAPPPADSRHMSAS
jgi:hypothetical protein